MLQFQRAEFVKGSLIGAETKGIPADHFTIDRSGTNLALKGLEGGLSRGSLLLRSKGTRTSGKEREAKDRLHFLFSE